MYNVRTILALILPVCLGLGLIYLAIVGRISEVAALLIVGIAAIAVALGISIIRDLEDK